MVAPLIYQATYVSYFAFWRFDIDTYNRFATNHAFVSKDSIALPAYVPIPDVYPAIFYYVEIAIATKPNSTMLFVLSAHYEGDSLNISVSQIIMAVKNYIAI